MACFGFLYIFFLIFAMIFFSPLPYNDAGSSTRYKTIPWVTIGLIVVNSLVFMLWIAPKYYLRFETLMSDRDMVSAYKPYIDMVWTYGYRESNLRQGVSIGAFTTFTSMFMHAELGHLMGNMAYLWAFGNRLEDACGHARFLGFYVLSGIVANMGSVILNPSVNDLPGIGASGAIAGVLGAYLLLFYDAKINVAWIMGGVFRLPYAVLASLSGGKSPLFRFRFTFPAWLLLIFFALTNTYYALESISDTNDQGGVNYLAHFAGFVAGLAIFLFARKDIVARYLTGRTL